MSDIIIIFAVLLGVILASIVANRLKKVPKAFITIAIGFALSFVPYIREHVALESEFFMMFIIDPFCIMTHSVLIRIALANIFDQLFTWQDHS